MASDVKIIKKQEHYELYINDVFQCSADTVIEAADEADKYLSGVEE